jgi:hypothetical protein
MASVFKGGRRIRAALIAGGLLAALVGVAGGPAVQAQTEPTFPGGATFNAYSAGANVHAAAVDGGVGGPRVADASIAFSSAATDSTTVKGIASETQNAIVPTPGTSGLAVDPAGDSAYGKGTALEVGLGASLPDENGDQIALSSRAEAAAQPIKTAPSDPKPAGANSADTGLVQSQQVEIPGSPLAYVNALPNEAEAVWSNKTCILGQPISYGRGRAATAQLVDAAADDGTTPDLDSPLVNVSQDFFGDSGRGAADTKSFTYLVNNGDGTFGVASETHMTFAPIGLLQTDPAAPAPIIIEILGEWVFRATATGKPGGAKVEYTVNYPSSDPDPAIIKGYIGVTDTTALPTFEIKRSQLFGATGIGVPGSPLVDAAIGEDARPIDTDPTDGIVAPEIAAAPPTQAADGTLASGAADVIRADLLTLAPGVEIAGLRIGHLEAKAQAPAGGFRCTIPVSKTGPPTGNAGQNLTWTIKVPSDPEALRGLACDLVNISVTDTIKTTGGNASGSIQSISAQGKTVSGNLGPKATLGGLGPYKVGDPPIEVTVVAKLSGSGTIENTADVVANLANCGQGNLSGKISGFANLAKVTGTAEVLGTAKVSGSGSAGGTTVAVLAARLPTTGANRLYTGLGLMALLSAAGVYLLNRKVSGSTS